MTPPTPGRSFQSREAFQRFVHETCPDADPASVQLFGAIHRAGSQLKQIAERRLEAAGLTWPKLRLLMMLMHVEREGQTDGLLPSELSERQNISRNTASALIAGLEEAGFITRELHESDHRKFLIRLTAKGRKVVAMQMAHHFRALGHSFDMLNAAEREQLLGLLHRVSAGLETR